MNRNQAPQPSPAAMQAAALIAQELAPYVSGQVQATMARAGIFAAPQSGFVPVAPMEDGEDPNAALMALILRKRGLTTNPPAPAPAPAPPPHPVADGLRQLLTNSNLALSTGAGTTAAAVVLTPAYAGEPQVGGRFRLSLTTGAAGLPGAVGEYTVVNVTFTTLVPPPAASSELSPVWSLVPLNTAARRLVLTNLYASPRLDSGGNIVGVAIRSDGDPLDASTVYDFAVVAM